MRVSEHSRLIGRRWATTILFHAAKITGAPTLDVRASLPAITGFDVGDIVNAGGDLYELVDDADENNTITGTSALHDTNYYGDSTFSWQAVDPFNMRLNLSKAGVGSSPPARIYGQFTSTAGVDRLHHLGALKWQ